MFTILLFILIIINFVLLTKGIFNVPTGMMITAYITLMLVGPSEAEPILRAAFSDFSFIAVLFTAVAVPAHILERSEALHYVGLSIGEFIGRVVKNGNKLKIPTIVAISLVMTYVMAALFHNTTSILVSASIIAVIAKSYKVPVIPILSGALIASNLGGFSTRWGDTPNIVEAHTWGIGYGVFFREILPINVGILILLILFTILVTQWNIRKNKNKDLSSYALVYSTLKFRSVKRNLTINKRLMWVGLTGLVIAVVGPLFFHSYELILSVLAIVISVVLDEKEHRNKSMFVLGIGTYFSLLSIFIIAKVMGQSSIGIGDQIYSMVKNTNGSVLAITISSYFGTLLTEAASWATAAAPIIHSVDASTRSAWALGAGICAGSSSLITAATAGIILLNETKDEEEQARMTFKKYYIFGLTFSGLMLIYYNITIPLLL